MSDEQQQAAAPGWYPVREGGLRWWDGQQWTEHRAPVQAGGPPVWPAMVAVKDPLETNHILHLLLSLVTCGLWLPVWFVIAWRNGEARTRRSVAAQQPPGI